MQFDIFTTKDDSLAYSWNYGVSIFYSIPCWDLEPLSPWRWWERKGEERGHLEKMAMSSGAVFFLCGGLWDGAAESVTVWLLSDQRRSLPACMRKRRQAGRLRNVHARLFMRWCAHLRGHTIVVYNHCLQSRNAYAQTHGPVTLIFFNFFFPSSGV